MLPRVLKTPTPVILGCLYTTGRIRGASFYKFPLPLASLFSDKTQNTYGFIIQNSKKLLTKEKMYCKRKGKIIGPNTINAHRENTAMKQLQRNRHLTKLGAAVKLLF